MKKIIAITTGGTIAMKYDKKTGGLIPAVSGEDLLAAVPPLKKIAQIEVVEFSNVPSEYFTPRMMLDLAKLVDKKAADDDVTGIIITHGTDTLEETAYFLDLALHTDKPVCMTGAMRGATDMSWDGPGNILAAAQAAICPDLIGQGVTVVLNNEIHAAREVTKAHSVNTDTFASPWWGPIGYVYQNGAEIKRHSIKRYKIPSDDIEEDVYLLKIAAGMDDFLLRCLVKKKVKGIVMEAFGCGNVPIAVKKGIDLARQNNIPVVLTTRAQAGRVEAVYGYEGSAGSMLSSGVILADEINGQKARLKLMLALKAAKNDEALRAYFE